MRRGSGSWLAVALGLGVGLGSGWLTARPAAAENKSEQERGAAAYVSQALRAEVVGKNSDREGLLQAALEEAPDHPAARWQSGYVRSGKQWVKFDEVPEMAAKDQRLADYQRIRQRYADTVEGQLELARWCKKARLPEQWRAHLGHVLQLDPDQKEARTLLGYQRVNGRWLTERDVELARSRAAAADAALAEWRPKLIQIRDGLEQRTAKRQDAAQGRLAAIRSSEAIPAIEAVLCEAEGTALAGVNKLATMPAAEASVALARQALFSPWPAVRQAATAKLKTRPRETFVPVLLSAMGSPIQNRIELFEDPATGQLQSRSIFYRPGQDGDPAAVFDSIYSRNRAVNAAPAEDARRSLVYNDAARAAMARVYGAYGDGVLAQAAANAARLANRAALPLDPRGAAANLRRPGTAAAAQGGAMLAVNRAICRLLAEITGVNLPEAPDAWSEWWAETNEVYVPGYRPTSLGYGPDGRVLTARSQNPMWDSYSYGIPVYHSCLVAGTPVWTETGPVAIERVRVGDRVLAQDVDTGQLTYKPVLHTTVRENAPLVKLNLLDDTITASSGHPFWIAGQGWVKARDIGPSAHFHGAAGTTPLERSGPGGVGRVYNLIVADFHSYFVGKAMVLSHDITRRNPSAMLVPGLARP